VPLNIIKINSISELLVLKQIWNKYFSCAFMMASQYNISHIEIWGWLFTNFLTHLLCYLWSFDKHFNLSSGLALVYDFFFFLLNIILIVFFVPRYIVLRKLFVWGTQIQPLQMQIWWRGGKEVDKPTIEHLFEVINAWEVVLRRLIHKCAYLKYVEARLGDRKLYADEILRDGFCVNMIDTPLCPLKVVTNL
jgi:hypothetical protein